jgi:hypothetical protein
MRFRALSGDERPPALPHSEAGASPFVRTGVVMMKRDSCASALAPRLSPKARGSCPHELRVYGTSAWLTARPAPITARARLDMI